MTGPTILPSSRLPRVAQSAHQRRLAQGRSAVTTLIATVFALFFNRWLRHFVRGFVFRLLTCVMLFPIRFFVTVMTTYQKRLRLHAPEYVAQDGYSVLEGVNIALDSIRYGPHPSETMDVITPKFQPSSSPLPSNQQEQQQQQQQEQHSNPYPIPAFSSFAASIATKKSGRDAPILVDGEYFQSAEGKNSHDGVNVQGAVAQTPIVYVHGGGFIMANSASLIHSVTCFARQGFTVYSVDYPSAPKDPFPKPLLSVVRAVWWVRNQHKVKHIILVGDSAGSNLAYMAAGLIDNPDTFRAYKQYLSAHGLWDSNDDYLVPPANANDNNTNNNNNNNSSTDNVAGENKKAGEMNSEQTSEWPYPKVSGVCSLYGYLMDLETWKTPVPSVSLFENTISTGLYHFASFAYRGYFSIGFRGEYPIHQSIPVSPAELIQTFRQNSNKTPPGRDNNRQGDDTNDLNLDLEPNSDTGSATARLAKILPELSASSQDLNLEVLDQSSRHHTLNKTTSWPCLEDEEQEQDGGDESDVSTDKEAVERNGANNESTRNLFQHFPRSLQVCGGKDTLVTSSKMFHSLLVDAGWESSLCILPMARHAFFGLPTSWTFGGWKTTAYPVCPLLMEFLTSCAVSSHSLHTSPPPPIDTTTSSSSASALLSPSLFSPSSSSSTSSAPLTSLPLPLPSSPSILNDREIYYGNHNRKKKSNRSSLKGDSMKNNSLRKQRPLTIGA